MKLLLGSQVKCHFGQKVGYFEKLFKISTFYVRGLLCEVAIGLPLVAWVVLWLESPRSSAKTIKSQNLWLEKLKISSSSSFYIAYFLNIRT